MANGNLTPVVVPGSSVINPQVDRLLGEGAGQQIVDPGNLLGGGPQIETGQLEAFLARMTPEALERLRAGTQQAIDLSGRAVGQAETALQPFGGTEAFDERADLLGARGPEAQQAAIDAIPFSQAGAFREEEEQKRLARGAAVRGELGGGATLAAQAQLGGAQAGRRIGERLDALAPLGDVERGTASTISGLQESAATREAQLRAGLGAQEASIRLGTAPQIASARSSAAEIQGLQQRAQANQRAALLEQFSNLAGRSSVNQPFTRSGPILSRSPGVTATTAPQNLPAQQPQLGASRSQEFFV